uniref:Uncharacterized protein n=1 Tax=Anguilla anguilla TaxID=7936 RepID=A0A0E9XQT9_ANGAN
MQICIFVQIYDDITVLNTTLSTWPKFPLPPAVLCASGGT